MQILYDGKIYSMQVTGGINRYFANLLGRLPGHFVPTLTCSQSHRFTYPVHSKLKIFKYKKFNPAYISNKLEKYYFRAIATFNKFDVVHPTYYSSLTEQSFSEYKYPVVITVHDMIHELFASQMDASGEQAKLKREAIMAADAIICVSENTKKDLLEQYPVSDKKIAVVYHAADIDVSMSHGSEFVPERPYYLYVGKHAAGYKNFNGLLTAFAKAVSVQPHVELCVVGPPFKKVEEQMIAELKLSNHVAYYGYVDDSHLAKLYRCSIAFVYPSLYEGFGIPTLEAMSCGTPVVASNRSSIPEVVGDAGLLFDPTSISDLTEILLLLLNSSTERIRFINKGYERVKEFSWNKTVAQTIDVYRSVSS